MSAHAADGREPLFHVFVKVEEQAVFIPCTAADSLEDVRERVLARPECCGGSDLWFRQTRVDYVKTLQEYGVLHSGHVFFWQ